MRLSQALKHAIYVCITWCAARIGRFEGCEPNGRSQSAAIFFKCLSRVIARMVNVNRKRLSTARNVMDVRFNLVKDTHLKLNVYLCGAKT